MAPDSTPTTPLTQHSPPALATEAAPPAPPVPTHRRTMGFEVFESDDGTELTVVATLADDRPWAAGTEWIEHVHDMELRVTVRRSDMTIVGAQARMHRYPHAECTGIEPAFDEGLVGLSVARGYTKAVQERFGRTKGCTHLELLARCIGPVVVQSIASSAARMRDLERTQEAIAEAGPAWFAGTCHVWAEDGPGMEKLALGWRPLASSYPAPSVVELRRAAPQR